MDAVKHSINAHLAQLRTKLDDSPTAQRLEVRDFIFGNFLQLLLLLVEVVCMRNDPPISPHHYYPPVYIVYIYFNNRIKQTYQKKYSPSAVPLQPYS